MSDDIRGKSVTDEIARQCVRFEALFKASQIDEMVGNFYAPDAILEGRDLPPQRGREAIHHVFADARAMCHSITIELDGVEVHGDVAFTGITNTNQLANGEIEVHRGIMIWRRFDAGWQVVRDFFFIEEHPFFGGLDPLLGEAARHPQRQAVAARKPGARAKRPVRAGKRKSVSL